MSSSGKSVKEFMEDAGRYHNNPYAGYDKEKRYKAEHSKQKPKRMYVKKDNLAEDKVPKDEQGLLNFLFKRRTDPDEPTDDELAIWMASERQKPNIISAIRNKYIGQVAEEIKDDPREQLALTRRHRYGDDIDIMRASFTKTIEQINDETFELLHQTRILHHAVMQLNKDIPKETKYRYGTLLENGVHSLLADCFRIQRKYYRRNMLESMHIELDILRT